MTLRTPDPSQVSATALVKFALGAWRATPAVRIDDAYKWLFQATRGGEHAVPDPDPARERLFREWARLPETATTASGAVPIEQLRPDGALVRVHLAPLKARGVDASAVLDAFLDGARAPLADQAGPDAFIRAWDVLRTCLAEAPVGELTLAAWQRLDAATRRAGFPAVHHSTAYREAYAPAYRVMPGATAARLLS